MYPSQSTRTIRVPQAARTGRFWLGSTPKKRPSNATGERRNATLPHNPLPGTPLQCRTIAPFPIAAVGSNSGSASTRSKVLDASSLLRASWREFAISPWPSAALDLANGTKVKAGEADVRVGLRRIKSAALHYVCHYSSLCVGELSSPQADPGASVPPNYLYYCISPVLPETLHRNHCPRDR